MSYGAYLHRTFFDPLAMRNTGVDHGADQPGVVSDLAISYKSGSHIQARHARTRAKVRERAYNDTEGGAM